MNESKSRLKAARLMVSKVSFVMSADTSTGPSRASQESNSSDNGEHDRVVAQHGRLGEGRAQPIVCQLPVGLVAVSREQPLPGELTQRHQPR